MAEAEAEGVQPGGKKLRRKKRQRVRGAAGDGAREWNREASARTGGGRDGVEEEFPRRKAGEGGPTRRKCCPVRKNGYSFSNVPDAHAHFPAERMVRGRRGREVVQGRKERRGGRAKKRGVDGGGRTRGGGRGRGGTVGGGNIEISNG